MRVLLIDAYPRDDPDSDVVEVAVATLESKGHVVERHRIAAGGTDVGFTPHMSEAEWAAYHSDEPLIAAETHHAAAAIRDAEALLFCHPTVMFTVPEVLKGWLERVLVPGVAFVFDRKGRVARGMTNITRIGMITTSGHSRSEIRRHRDLARRILLRTMSLNCHRFVRRTHVRLPAGSTDRSPIVRKLSRW